MIDELTQKLRDAMLEDKKVVVLAGSGITKASGLPTYEEVMKTQWPGFDRTVEDLAEFSTMQQNPDEVARFLFEIRDFISGFEPNVVHYTLADMCRWNPNFLVTSQNIDGLEGRAGIPQGQYYSIYGTLLTTKTVGGIDVPNVVFHGQPTPQHSIDFTKKAYTSADLLIVVGSSLRIPELRGWVDDAKNASVEVYEINSNPEGVGKAVVGKAEILLPEIWQRVKANLNEQAAESIGEVWQATLRSRPSRAESDSDTTSGIVPSYLNGQTVDRAIIGIEAKGCLYERKDECTHCGIRASNLWHPNISGREIVRRFETEFRKYYDGTGRGPPILTLLQYGNIFDNTEFPREHKQTMLELISNEPAIRKVFVESRPEMINYRNARNVVEALKGKEVEIGIALESADDFVRKRIIKKSFDLWQYDRAAQIVQDSGAIFMAYVLVAPMYLTEQEARDDALSTAQYVIDRGARSVSFEPLTRLGNSLQDNLHGAGRFREPWLWTLIDLAQQTHIYTSKQAKPLEVRLGGIVHHPLPESLPYNCDSCTETLMYVIASYNAANNPAVFNPRLYQIGSKEFAALTCDCKQEWSTQMELQQPPLPKRIIQTNKLLVK